MLCAALKTMSYEEITVGTDNSSHSQSVWTEQSAPHAVVLL